MGMMETVIEIPAGHESNIFGQLDAYAKKIERALHVTLIARGESMKVIGEGRNVEKAKSALSQLTELSKRGNTIQEQNVDYVLSLVLRSTGILSAIPLRESLLSRRRLGRKNMWTQSAGR